MANKQKIMQSITLPQKPKFTNLGENAGKFEIEGCYPGYGTTLGNALRRILLSSLAGSAITSVKIKGVTHEFSTVPNILEDVIQIILNLKQVRIKSYNNEPVKISLKANGEKIITAGMIKCPSGVEIITKDAHIATITSPKGELEMEFEVKSGIGYVPVEQQERGEKEIGVIAIDAIYTPIKRVNYNIENMRVGKKTDYEKITLEIITDGSIDSKDAFDKAVSILVEQFSVFSQLATEETAVIEKAVVEEVVSEIKEEKKEDPNKVEVATLKSLSTRTLNILETNNIKTIGDIVVMTEAELTDIEGMGAKGIKEIKKSIGDFGINLKQDK